MLIWPTGSLGLTEPFMHKLVDVVVQEMGSAFPELKKNPQHVAELVKDEEVSFRQDTRSRIAYSGVCLATRSTKHAMAVRIRRKADSQAIKPVEMDWIARCRL